MRSAGQAVALAVPFVWLGMVLAISFLEAPLKFRAPGITLPLGLGIGRLIFRALNLAEIGLAALLTIACLIARPSGSAWRRVAAQAARRAGRGTHRHDGIHVAEDVGRAGCSEPIKPASISGLPPRPGHQLVQCHVLSGRHYAEQQTASGSHELRGHHDGARPQGPRSVRLHCLREDEPRGSTGQGGTVALSDARRY
jgi:hypothetical protein